MKWLIFFSLTVAATVFYVRHRDSTPETTKSSSAPVTQPMEQGTDDLDENNNQKQPILAPRALGPQRLNQPSMAPQSPNEAPASNYFRSEQEQNVPPPVNDETYQPNNNFSPPSENPGYFQSPPPPPIDSPDDSIVPQVMPPDMEIPPPPPIAPEENNNFDMVPTPENPSPFEPPPDFNNGENNQFYSPPPPIEDQSF